jgi:hypothetical protein
VLDLGKAGSAGVEEGAVPVLRDAVMAATLRASNWREAATAVIGDQEWVYAMARRQLTGRRVQDPEGTARCRARQVSAWKGNWAVDLEGTAVEVRTASWWKTTQVFLLWLEPVVRRRAAAAASAA